MPLLQEYDPGEGATAGDYVENCCRFSQDVLKVKLWHRQVDLVYSIYEKPKTKTACRSGHSTGKSGVSSVVFEYHLSCLGRCVWTTAPSMEQVHKLWAEVMVHRDQATRFLPGTIVAGGPSVAPRLKTANKALWAKGFSTNRAERAQGLHIPELLIIMDEGAGVDEHIWIAVRSSLASAGVKLLVLGNPNEKRNSFWRIFWGKDLRDRWSKHHISSLETPNISDAERKYFNEVILPAFRSGRYDLAELEKGMPPASEPVIPGLAAMDWVMDQMADYRDQPNIFDNRVLGDIANDDSKYATIPGSYIDAAMDLWNELEEEEEFYPEPPKIHSAFLDVAGQGNDRCSLSFLRGQRFHVQKWWFDRSDEGQVNIANDTAEWVINLPQDQKPQWLAVDVDAVGVGVFSMLAKHRRLNKAAWGRCKLLKFHWGWGASKHRTNEFERIISEVYWDLRKALDPTKPREERLALPPGANLKPDPLTRQELFEQLNARSYEYDIRERVVVQSKQALKGASPDVADSIAGCMWRPPIVKVASS